MPLILYFSSLTLKILVPKNINIIIYYFVLHYVENTNIKTSIIPMADSC